jgi:hypothetical protein
MTNITEQRPRAVRNMPFAADLAEQGVPERCDHGPGGQYSRNKTVNAEYLASKVTLE